MAVYIRVFDPFGMAILDSGVQNKLMGGYFMINTLVLGIVFAIDYLLLKILSYMQSAVRFTIFSLLGVLSLSVAAWIFNHNIGQLLILDKPFLSLLFDIITAILLPIVLIYLVMIRITLQQAQKVAKNLQVQISGIEPQPIDETITLKDDNDNILIELSVSNLLYIQGSDNYCTIFFLKDEKPAKEMLRFTLKGIENQTDRFENIVRCHRSFIVNLNKIKRVSGNAQGYKLHVENDKQVIPVSRSFPKDIIQKIRKQ